MQLVSVCAAVEMTTEHVILLTCSHFLHLKYCLASKTYKNCYGPKFNVVWVRCINFFTQNSEYLWEFRMVFQIKHVFLLFICIKITSVPSNFTLIQNKKLNPPTLSYPSLSPALSSITNKNNEKNLCILVLPRLP